MLGGFLLAMWDLLAVHLRSILSAGGCLEAACQAKKHQLETRFRPNARSSRYTLGNWDWPAVSPKADQRTEAQMTRDENLRP